MRAAVYARVSTSNHGQDPKLQLREIAEYCQRRGWTVTSEYVDVGISGTKEKRPELDRLLADAHRRHFDAVVVWRFDRFARSVSHLLRALETFKALGIEFVSLSEQVDTSTPAGKLVFTVSGAVAELERSLIAERGRAGLRNARSSAQGDRSRRNQAIAICWLIVASSGCGSRCECGHGVLSSAKEQESVGGQMKAYFINKRLAFGSGIKTWRHVEQLQALGITHL